jgi:signal transduction histidine kinase
MNPSSPPEQRHRPAARDFEGERDVERDWLAAFGHELNSALQSLVLGVSVAERLLEDEPELARAHLETARRNAALMGRLIGDHLAATVHGLGALECHDRPIELATFLPRAVQTAQLPGARHPLRYAIEPRLRVRADPDRLQQILTNLLSNAAKYATPGQLTLGAISAQDRAIVWLRDSGPGLSHVELARLFQRYSRLPSKSRGLGIGLWFSRELARRMGGELNATSSGSSSTFHLSLPLVTAN